MLVRAFWQDDTRSVVQIPRRIAVLALLVGLWPALPGRNTYRSPFRMKLRDYAYGVGLLLLMALWIPPLVFKGLRYGPFLRAFLVGNFPIIVPAMLAACVLLWIRHERAFRYVEIGSPLYNLNPRQ